MTRKTFNVRIKSYPKDNSKVKIDTLQFVSEILLPNGIEIYSDPYNNINIRIRNKEKNNVLYSLMSKLDKDQKDGIVKTN